MTTTTVDTTVDVPSLAARVAPPCAIAIMGARVIGGIVGPRYCSVKNRPLSSVK